MDVDEVEEVEGSEGTPAVKDAREGKNEDHAAVSRSIGSTFPPRSSVTASLAISEGLGDGSRAHQGRHKHSDKLTIFRLVSTAKLDNRVHLSPVSVAERSRVDCVLVPESISFLLAHSLSTNNRISSSLSITASLRSLTRD